MRLFVLLAAVTLAVSGCSGADPARPGVLSVGIREPATLLPADLSDQAGRLVTGALWTPLADYDAASGKVTPRAAASIESTDRVHWTVKLRPATFHDGTPVTAQSYVDTWQAIAASRWVSSPVLTKLLRAREIKAAAPDTIALTLDRPSGQVPVLLSAPGLVPLPASVLASRDWNGFAKAPVGNGPYRLDSEWKPGSGGTLKRVGAGKAEEIELRVGEPAAQYDAVKAGTLDLATEVPGAQHEAMHGDFADRHATWALPEAGYLAFPVTNPRFADATVRHGFALGVDRAALEAGPLAHQVDPAKALLPPADAPGERSGTCRPCSFDAAAGKALLKQAGFPGGATVYFGPGAEEWTRTLVVGLHKALDVSVTAQAAPRTDRLDGPSTLDVKLTTGSPDELLTQLATAAGYADDTFRQNLSLADAAATPEEAGELYRLAENQLLRDLPVAPLWSGHGHAVWAPRVHDVTATPFTGPVLAGIGVS
ncbi:oligopeptide transport system substrate-binding protein [Amycolatopsis tolypomycina]|uniref:Oligopeptide transport system substrate-binding protein n=1 Tax=Amycolatopsis tolypomycina TaxID=208445 RepID=A0A1H5A3T9_9PSEU|nr:ABC transporter substrate-binding protein [Amycolatopsis tolypomycina]SED36917.1 oligopeptide transport system substrate-binding protein [Amycolatopsis tolypomycina]